MNDNINILVPELPESVTDAIVLTWHKKIGETVNRNDPLVDIETDKIILEIPSPSTGVLNNIYYEEGSTVLSKQILGELIEHNSHYQERHVNKKLCNKKHTIEDNSKNIILNKQKEILSPSLRRLLSSDKKNTENILGSNNINNIVKSNIDNNFLNSKANEKYRNEKRVPMSRLRQSIAKRLLHTKNNTAMLTTFNEVNMKPIIDIREKYGKEFQEHHNVKLGFMSFFVKATIVALKKYPEINSSIDNDQIIFFNYFDINVAISTSRGLVAPVIKDANLKSMYQIEKHIKDLAKKGENGKLTIDELTGGTFTISNGGIFGSLMSTPIMNPPQTAILGMNTIHYRPIAINNTKIKILPMMYLALSYDHCLVDGKESIGFLKTIKEVLEDFNRVLLDI